MTGPRPVFQRWIEVDPPEGAGREPPMWSWPVGLGDGRTILTLLYRPLPAPGSQRSKPKTQILEISPEGDASVWAPGAGYPLPVIFCASDRDELWGFDLSDVSKIYACRADGTHLVTAEISLLLGNLIAPEYFLHRGNEAWWIDRSHRNRHGRVTPAGIVDVEEAAALPDRPCEVRFPHTHVTAGRLYVLDFDPMARISVYKL